MTEGPRRLPPTGSLDYEGQLLVADLLDRFTNGAGGLHDMRDQRIRQARRDVFVAIDVPCPPSWKRAASIVVTADPVQTLGGVVEEFSDFDPFNEASPTRVQIVEALARLLLASPDVPF